MSITSSVKTRDLVAMPPGTAYATFTVFGQPSVSPFRYSQIGRETTTSRDNPDWTNFRRYRREHARDGKPIPEHMKLILRNTDAGNGDFESVKRYVEASPRWVSPRHVDPTYTYAYDGPWFAVDNLVGPDSSRFPAAPSDLADVMLAMGTTAIARTIPTNPIAGAAQFLGELREGLPAIPGASLARRDGAGGLADEYVNLEFALKPIISDLQKFGEAVTTADKVVAQLERDSGRLVRRRYSFPVDRTVTGPDLLSSNAWGSPPLRTGGTGAYRSGPGKLYRTRTVEKRFWFSGGYTYYYSSGDSARERLKGTEQKLARLFGLRLTPELLWELTPWSWLVDWSSNTGDIIRNLSALHNDSLVLRYGYMMAHVVIRDTYLLDGVVLKDGSGGPLSQTFVTEVKKRVKATPYGFGLDPDAYTGRQKAILAALGISRVAK